LKTINKKIEETPIAKLKEHPLNPRRGDEAAIEKSIDKNGFYGVVVAQVSTGFVLAGNHRLRAAAKAGAKKIPVAWVDVSDEEAKKILVADNRTSELGGYDSHALAVILDELNAEGTLEGTGYDLDNLDDMISELGKTIEVGGFMRRPPSLQEEAESVPAPEQTPTARSGDMWKMGDHRLICGDSSKMETVKRLMDGQEANLWLTDPPYNVDYNGLTEGALKIDNDNISDGDFLKLLTGAYAAANAALAPGGVFYIWHAPSEGYNFYAAAVETGWRVRQCLIWLKNRLVLGRQDYHWKHEPCLYGWKPGAAHYWGTDRKQTTILEFDRPDKNPDHPTMKPIELFQYQMENSSKKGDIVLDSFGGSGTTMIAAERAGRRARIVEMDPRYCDVIIKRWENFTGGKAVLIGGENEK